MFSTSILLQYEYMAGTTEHAGERIGGKHLAAWTEKEQPLVTRLGAASSLLLLEVLANDFGA